MKSEKLRLFISLVRQDKTFLVLLAMLIFTTVWMVFDVILNIEPSQIQKWHRFVSFGVDNYNRTYWLYFYNWAILPFIITSLHITLAAKLFKSNYRRTAALMLGLGVLLVIIADVSFNLIMGLPG